MSEGLWDKLQLAENPLIKLKEKACIYLKPFENNSEVVCWFYSSNNACQIFFGCSQSVWKIMNEDSWADVSEEFVIYVEHELMPFCVENTEWERCERDGIDYSETATNGDSGCDGCSCSCEPFGEGDFTYGIAEESEFDLSVRLENNFKEITNQSNKEPKT